MHHAICRRRVSLVVVVFGRPRPFHGSAPARSALLDLCCSSTHSALGALHATTGLPWAVALPLSAALVRTVLVLPLSVYSQRNRARLAAAVTPLLHAWRPILERAVVAEHGASGATRCARVLARRMRAKRRELTAGLGLRALPSHAGWLQLPVWLVAIETVRRMCGAPRGLLGLVFSSSSSSDSSSSSSDSCFEASLGTEGALWFPDLLAPDPLLCLPMLLAASLYLNVARDEAKALRAGPAPAWSRRLTRALKLLALAVAPATLDVPAAMLLYWLASSLCALGHKELVDRVVPLPRPVAPGRRGRGRGGGAGSGRGSSVVEGSPFPTRPSSLPKTASN